MTRWLRIFLFRALGAEGYLRLVSRVYLSLVRRRLVVQQYPELFFAQRLVQPGDVCVDIGANLGYYAVPLARRCGPEGRVYAVEPVPLFARILQENVARAGLENVTLVRQALGAEAGMAQMGTPRVEGVFRHGRTRVLGEGGHLAVQTYAVPVARPDDLFAGLDRLDFVKCDVEGYEIQLFPHFLETLHRHRPVVQVEISTAEKRRRMAELLAPLGYRVCALQGGRLASLSPAEMMALDGRDFYFLPDAAAH